MGEDVETIPAALARAFCSTSGLISFISPTRYQSGAAAPPHTKAASLLKSAANEPGRWLE